MLGTALATSAFVGGYRGYVRRAYAACAPTAGTYLCSGVTTTTQKLPGSPGGVLTVTTDNTFDIDTPVGDALTLTGTGGLTFSDPNFSTITGAVNGIVARNSTSGALSISATGVVTGTSLIGIYTRNNNLGADLSIEAVDVSGGDTASLHAVRQRRTLDHRHRLGHGDGQSRHLRAQHQWHRSIDRGGGCERRGGRHYRP